MLSYNENPAYLHGLYFPNQLLLIQRSGGDRKVTKELRIEKVKKTTIAIVYESGKEELEKKTRIGNNLHKMIEGKEEGLKRG